MSDLKVGDIFEDCGTFYKVDLVVNGDVYSHVIEKSEEVEKTQNTAVSIDEPKTVKPTVKTPSKKPQKAKNGNKK